MRRLKKLKTAPPSPWGLCWRKEAVRFSFSCLLISFAAIFLCAGPTAMAGTAVYQEDSENVLAKNIDVATFNLTDGGTGERGVEINLTPLSSTLDSSPKPFTTVVTPDNKDTPTTQAACGDGYCDMGENAVNCTADCPPIQQCGDVNLDGYIDTNDILFLVNYLFVTGDPAPSEPWRADLNSNGEITISDITYLIDYLYISKMPLSCTIPES